MKEAWRQKYTPLKLEIAKRMAKYLPELEVRAAAFTSIDITKKGFDKHFGIDELTKLLKIPKENTVYVGDALYPGGNDESAIAAGVDTVKVKGPEDTEEWIKQFLNHENI
jgi:hydroxymethylpyrimidine pyrophosphatase-like HAD family hydrolase